MQNERGAGDKRTEMRSREKERTCPNGILVHGSITFLFLDSRRYPSPLLKFVRG